MTIGKLFGVGLYHINKICLFTPYLFCYLSILFIWPFWKDRVSLKYQENHQIAVPGIENGCRGWGKQHNSYKQIQ